MYKGNRRIVMSFKSLLIELEKQDFDIDRGLRVETVRIVDVDEGHVPLM